MANEIVKDFQGGQNAVERSPDLIQPSGWDAFLGALGGAVEGTRKVFEIAASKGTTGKGSTKEVKDYSPLTNAVQKLRNAVESGETSYEKRRVMEDNLVNEALADGKYTLNDVQQAMDLSGYSPIQKTNESITQQSLDYQKNTRDTIMAVADSFVPYGATEEQRYNAGILRLAEADATKATLAAVKNLPKEDAEKLIAANLNNLTQTINKDLIEAVSKYGFGSEVIGAFRANYISNLVNTYNVPYNTAAKLVSAVVEPAVQVLKNTKEETGDVAAIQENGLKYLQNGAALKVQTQVFEFNDPSESNPDGTPRKIKMTGAELGVLSKFAPQAIDTLVNTNLTNLLGSLATNGSVSGLTYNELGYFVSPGRLSQFLHENNSEGAKDNAVNIYNAVSDRIIEDAVNTPKEELAANNQYYKASDVQNNALDGLTAEDFNSNKVLNSNREKIANNLARSVGIGTNALTDGEGVVIMDRFGNFRYIKSTTGSSMYDDTHAGWLIPLGDQDAISARTSGRTEALRTIRNMAKAVGIDKAVEDFNINQIMNSVALRKYADYRRRKASGEIKETDLIGVGYNVPMSEAEAREIYKEIQGLPPDRTLEVLRTIKGGVIEPVIEGLKAATGYEAVKEAVASLGDAFSTNTEQSIQALKQYLISQGVDADAVEASIKRLGYNRK